MLLVRILAFLSVSYSTGLGKCKKTKLVFQQDSYEVRMAVIFYFTERFLKVLKDCSPSLLEFAYVLVG